VLAALDLIGVPEDKANRLGGALALGHPFGASGALLVLRLLAQARTEAVDGAHALAMVSIAGGLGLAALFRWEGTPVSAPVESPVGWACTSPRRPGRPV